MMPQHIKNWPEHRHLGNGTRGLLLLLLTFTEGWAVCYAITHDNLPSPIGTGTPQWAITGSVIIALIIPFIWYTLLRHDHEDDDKDKR